MSHARASGIVDCHRAERQRCTSWQSIASGSALVAITVLVVAEPATVIAALGAALAFFALGRGRYRSLKDW
jgi:hypothetical protein